MALVMAMVAVVACGVVAVARAAAPPALASRSGGMRSGEEGWWWALESEETWETLCSLGRLRASKAGQEVLKNPPVRICVGLFGGGKLGWRAEAAWLPRTPQP